MPENFFGKICAQVVTIGAKASGRTGSTTTAENIILVHDTSRRTAKSKDISGIMEGYPESVRA